MRLILFRSLYQRSICNPYYTKMRFNMSSQTQFDRLEMRLQSITDLVIAIIQKNKSMICFSKSMRDVWCLVTTSNVYNILRIFISLISLIMQININFNFIEQMVIFSPDIILINLMYNVQHILP